VELAYDAGFEIEEGKKVRAHLRIGDNVPGSNLPNGKWTAKGLGKCLKCGTWIIAQIHVEGSAIVSVDGMALPNP
jgi:hypothetical protein